LKPVQGRDVRPTSDRVREAWMSAMGPSIPGARVLDLFAGSGALGLECLSRGAASVVLVERARGALKVLEGNVALLGAGDRATVVAADALSWLRKLPPLSFDLALADPPYQRGFAAELLEIWTASPFARELWVEHRSSDPFPSRPGARQRRYGDTVLTTLVTDVDHP